MKVKLIVPFLEQQRGNTITVKRIAKGLQMQNISTEIVDARVTSVMDDTQNVDLYHGFHAVHFYTFMEKATFAPTPYMITMTGTDLNKDLFDEQKRSHVVETLKGAEAIHVFEEKGKHIVTREVPEVADKLYVIPQGVSTFPQVPRSYRKEKGTFLFILPAGLRQIKNISSAIFMLEKLQKTYPQIRLWLVGPVIEAEEGAYIQQLVEEREWIRYVGQLPHEQMGAFIEQGDVVLNTSFSEGQSSAILEAMAVGIPTLVSNNNGNRSIVTNEVTGFVYQNEGQFMTYAQQVIEDAQLRQQLGTQARAYVEAHHSLNREIQSLRTIYKQIVQRSCSCDVSRKY